MRSINAFPVRSQLDPIFTIESDIETESMLRYVGTSRKYDDIGLGFDSVESLDAGFGNAPYWAICEMDIVLVQRFKPASIESGPFAPES